MDVLPKGYACLRCRRLKEKCNGLRPACTRCRYHRQECVYASGITARKRGPILGSLQARADQLQTVVHKLTIASAHDLLLASTKLQRRIGRLGSVEPELLSATSGTPWLPIYPLPEKHGPGWQGGQIVGADVTEGYTSVVQRALVEHKLNSYKLVGSEELPLPLSLHLISLFLPYRSHYYFFVDVPRFLHCVTLPSSHPDSIHPCLLNACYLCACGSSRGGLTLLQPYFIKRTRHFLDQALMFTDRITHFLWASIILSCFLARERRLDECFAVAGAATHLASAFGLISPQSSMGGQNSRNGISLLPPPKDDIEVMDRIRLAQAIYMTDQTAPVLGGHLPIFPYDHRWSLTPEEALPRYQSSKFSKNGSMENHLSELWQSDMHLKVSIMRMFDQASKFARSVHENGFHGFEDEYVRLRTKLYIHEISIPPLSDPRGLRPLEAVSTFNPHLLLAHTTLYGSGLILHSVRSGDDPEARFKMLECAQALVGICEHVRGHKRLRKVQAGLVNVVHVMNAIRVFARELKKPDVRGNARLSTNYCHTIELLLDFIDDTTLLFPAWTDTPVLLKDTLTAAVSTLTT
ncbi:hypothetical protein DL93DRAFT_2233306 [Clavulina sp. PMI_390]|nr:hypothetical protein DL93DRAFT_2233306 [Clavulina sp. PMI_390]